MKENASLLSWSHPIPCHVAVHALFSLGDARTRSTRKTILIIDEASRSPLTVYASAHETKQCYALDGICACACGGSNVCAEPSSATETDKKKRSTRICFFCLSPSFASLLTMQCKQRSNACRSVVEWWTLNNIALLSFQPRCNMVDIPRTYRTFASQRQQQLQHTTWTTSADDVVLLKFEWTSFHPPPPFPPLSRSVNTIFDKKSLCVISGPSILFSLFAPNEGIKIKCKRRKAKRKKMGKTFVAVLCVRFWCS